MQGFGMVGLVFIIGFFTVKMLLDKQQQPPRRSVASVPPQPGKIVESPVASREEVVEAPVAADASLPVDGILTENGITCLICGNIYKSLRVHLNRGHKLSVEAYCAQFGLPRDTPMTFPVRQG
ncbi:MAG: MucR family transcriptional regulator [Magnetococcales bacterium]|nr:MucR family transcriptional regulator [Magnetococcales bacterium]